MLVSMFHCTLDIWHKSYTWLADQRCDFITICDIQIRKGVPLLSVWPKVITFVPNCICMLLHNLNWTTVSQMSYAAQGQLLSVTSKQAVCAVTEKRTTCEQWKRTFFHVSHTCTLSRSDSNARMTDFFMSTLGLSLGKKRKGNTWHELHAEQIVQHLKLPWTGAESDYHFEGV